MFPILKKEFALLKQYKSSIIYPIFSSNNSAVMSGIYSYERINETAAEIMELCNGSNSIIDIGNILSEKHNCSLKNCLPLVKSFIESAAKKEYLLFSEKRSTTPINVSGSFDVVFPFNAQIEITKKCPLKCRHCFNSSGAVKSQEMSTSQVFTVIDKLSSIGIKKVMITGGEPSSRSDFIQIVTYASKKFMAISIATNGYFITSERIANLSKLKNIVVQVSLDGTEDHHNFIRGVKDSFSKAVQAIINLSKAKVPVVVASTFNSYNIGDIEYLTKLAKESGARQITYSVTNQIGRAKENCDLFGFSTDALLVDANRMKEQYGDKTFYIHVNDSDRDSKKLFSTCGRGCTQICVRENGDVSPCVQFNLAYGNLLTQDVYDIFNYKRVKWFLAIPEPDYQVCSKCEKLVECGGCVALAWDMPASDCAWKQKNPELVEIINRQNIHQERGTCSEQ